MQEWFMGGTILIYNLFIIIYVVSLSNKVSLKELLKEKGSPTKAVAAARYAARVAVEAARVADPAAAQALQAPAADPTAPTPAEPPADEGTSYSRAAGMVGAVVLSGFVWALGNVVLYKGFTAPTEIKDLLTGVAPFLLASSTLFAPYAFNQLSEVFKS
ncbi:MAG: hypothetical protein JOZ40_10345 [Methylobacteriaceae bacterium]|nr:hypothetical protein [Methylobacteriaceae bacterium]